MPGFSLVFSSRTVPSALDLPQIMPPAVAYGLYRRSGIGKAFLVFPHPAPKTVYCSTLEDEKGVAGVTRDKQVACVRFSFFTTCDHMQVGADPTRSRLHSWRSRLARADHTQAARSCPPHSAP